MNIEYEVKFVNIDIAAIRDKLLALGAQLEVSMRLMRRVTIDNPGMKAKNAFVRIRDQGDKIVITYKQFDELSIEGAKEHEVEVSDFDETIALFAAAGLPYGSFQESKRETWTLDGAEIVIDEWPWLNPYIEIEGDSENHVKDVSAKLGFDWRSAVFGDVMAAYRQQYPHLSEKDTVGNIPEVKFGDPLPDLLK
ncbi:MAG: CYTH domain-containing protein [Candidatus Saccharimonas sp.]